MGLVVGGETDRQPDRQTDKQTEIHSPVEHVRSKIIHQCPQPTQFPMTKLTDDFYRHKLTIAKSSEILSTARMFILNIR